MRLVRKSAAAPRKLAVLSGSFHPVTVAHMSLAQAALPYADEVLFVLPEQFPHKTYGQVPLATRLSILIAAIQGEPRFLAAVTQGGLFLEIARECREEWPNLQQIWFLCGRDAAERITGWHYEELPPVEEQLKEFGLLVASRMGSWNPPAAVSAAVQRIEIDAKFNLISATHVRELIWQGLPWEHLVPAGAVEGVRRTYPKKGG